MNDKDTGLTMTMAAQSKPKNPRVSENNLFEIVTWTPGLGDPHKWRSRDHFLSSIKTQDYLIYRLRKCDDERREALAVLQGTDRPVAGYAFASYDLLRLEFGVEGDIGPEEVKRAENMLLVELLTYEEYITGRVYSFKIVNRAGVVIERQGDIYGEDYAEHLAQTAFETHRITIGAGSR